MNSEEPITTVNANDSISTQGKDLPEQSQLTTVSMPREISMLSLINQWQPMGFRIVLNLPFVGDDSSFLFYIRVGPFIPPPPGVIQSVDNAYDNTEIYQSRVSCYSYNNMVPVFLFSDEAGPYPPPENHVYPITVTQHDMPPVISTISRSFRFWRGDMDYRIRTVAGFATQGYLVISPLKNSFVPIGVYDTYSVRPAIQRQDKSYRASMMNSYALCDTSMYRHVEITYPYDYPTPYYDQYAWMARRVTPAPYILPYSGAGKPPVNPVLRSGGIYSEPHGDNFICVGVRGDLAATQAGSQIMFELEYRCREGFQFADPFLPPHDTVYSAKTARTKGYLPNSYPDDHKRSDGIGLPYPKAQSGRQASLLSSLSRGTSSRMG